jgi:hypothetical protein
MPETLSAPLPGSGVQCIDCTEPGRPAPYAGPRCWTHHTATRKTRRKKAQATRRANTYSITPEEQAELLAYQDGKCAICRRRRGTRLDHDHSCCNGPKSCGKCVRGFLCDICNRYLGMIRDDPNAGRRMAAYLERPPRARIDDFEPRGKWLEGIPEPGRV